MADSATHGASVYTLSEKGAERVGHVLGPQGLIVQANGARFRQMCYVLDEARKAGIKHVLVETDAAPDSYYPLTWF